MTRHRTPPSVALAALLLLAAGCAGGLRGGVFTKGALRYTVAAPAGDAWRPVGFADNDLAWVDDHSGQLLALNSTCPDHGDPSLEVLTTHLLFGFTDQQLLARDRESVDGREALRSRYRARLDGVPVMLELLVLKKNGCVHDFTYVAPVGQELAHEAQFDALVHGFHQEAAP